MIISASRRTDIPAFYSDWFINRIREGFFYRVNPFNHKQVSGFSLNPEIVDAICFWSKNPQPLMSYLDELDQRGFSYYFQFTSILMTRNLSRKYRFLKSGSLHSRCWRNGSALSE